MTDHISEQSFSQVKSIPLMLTINELAQKCKGSGITPYRIRQMALEGTIPCIRAGNKILINADRFADYLNNPNQNPDMTLQGKIRPLSWR